MSGARGFFGYSPEEMDAGRDAEESRLAAIAACKRCNGEGWLPPIEGDDGSVVTSRPCSCNR